MMNSNNDVLMCRRHWITFAKDIVLIVLILIAAIIFGRGTSGIIPLILVVVAIVLFLRALIAYKSTYIRLTETSVIGHVGFLNSKTLTTAIVKVQDISLSNGLFGKIFGYHTIRISNAGSAGTEYVFTHMTNAQKLVEEVQARIAA